MVWLFTGKPSLVAQMVKCLSTMLETRVQSLGWEDLLEKEMAIHSSSLAWKIPQTGEPGRLQSVRSQRVEHDWATKLEQEDKKQGLPIYSLFNQNDLNSKFWKSTRKRCFKWNLLYNAEFIVYVGLIKKSEHQRIDSFELRCWRRLLRVPWTARRSNQSILKEISP